MAWLNDPSPQPGPAGAVALVTHVVGKPAAAWFGFAVRW